MSADPRPDYVERPMYFDVDGEAVFGILTRSLDEHVDTAVIVLPGGGVPLTTNRNRLTVRICRDLAGLGVAAFRMDYHGTGESTGSVGGFHTGHPFWGDVRAAISRLKEEGLTRFVLVGSCFGSRTALSAAAHLDDVEEVLLFSVPLGDYAMGERKSVTTAQRHHLGHYARAALRPRTWRALLSRRGRWVLWNHARAKLRVIWTRLSRLAGRAPSSEPHAEHISPRFRRGLERLIERGVPVTFVFGDDEDYHREFEEARRHELGEILARGGSKVRIVTLPGRIHGFTTLASQDASLGVITEWARGRRAGFVPGTPTDVAS
ncbi:MAG TPA: hypothetical protein VIC58_11285 [Actinomycetota bacterium]|jgi:pimeloyl-ACP methyl ester carboxylesterase